MTGRTFYLYSNCRRISAKAHRTDPQFIHGITKVLLEWVHGVHGEKERLFCK